MNFVLLVETWNCINRVGVIRKDIFVNFKHDLVEMF